jgi:hypothetical protein
MQLHWVIENAKIFRSVDGLSSLVTGLRDAIKRYNASVFVRSLCYCLSPR